MTRQFRVTQTRRARITRTIWADCLAEALFRFNAMPDDTPPHIELVGGQDNPVQAVPITSDGKPAPHG